MDEVIGTCYTTIISLSEAWSLLQSFPTACLAAKWLESRGEGEENKSEESSVEDAVQHADISRRVSSSGLHPAFDSLLGR